LGALWAVLQPFLLMMVFTLFFSQKFTTPGLPYPVFVFSGLILWNIFSSGITNAGNSMINNSNIIKKIYFPRLIIPISSIMGTLADFAMTLVMFIIILIYYSPPISIIHFVVNLPLALLITLMTTFGLGSLLAALNVKYRDFRYVIPFMVQILLFLTPVIYPVSVLQEGLLGQILLLNPMAGAIEILRSSFYDSAISSLLILKSVGIATLLFITGLVYFRKTEYYFADLV
jgi:lipopolysaccharide transport system permease protein